MSSKIHAFGLAVFLFCGTAANTFIPRQITTQTGFEDIIARYRQTIPQLMSEQNIPGLSLAVVDDEKVLWTEGFGFTDDDRKTAVTPDTIFSVQSASKPFTATAVLTAVQAGLLDLDTPITTYLPAFTVHSIFEANPERKITLRMLLSHTAGFTVEAPVGNNYELEPGTFEEHIQSISATWLRFPVGSGYAYSNLGVDLAGYILQTVSGEPFDTYVQEHVLQPLGMNNSSFDMKQIQVHPNRAIGHSDPLPKVPLVVPMIPSGGFYTSAADMARFIQFQLNQGTLNDTAVLNEALIHEMDTIPAPNEGSREGYALGIGKTGWHAVRDTVLFFHGGGGFGFLADLWWLPDLKLGITVLTNSSEHDLQGFLALQILKDFVNEPGSVYAQRLQALPFTSPVIEGDGHFRPPAGLAQVIELQALPTSAADLARWKKYVGAYGRPNWDVVSPEAAYLNLFLRDDHLYLKVTEEATEWELVEALPGLFFAPNGEALDLRGHQPTWRNMKLIRTGEGASVWQKILLAGCALIFLAGLVWLPLRTLRRRTSPPAKAARGWTLLVCGTGILASLSGLASIAVVFLFPLIIYSGFLGWLHLPFWQRAITHAPLLLMFFGAGFISLTVQAWKRRSWAAVEKVMTLAFCLAILVASLFMGFWHLIGISLG
jgi:CubicO group peptidase (beta-lactamase class C family)